MPGWFVGIMGALVLLAYGYLVFASVDAGAREKNERAAGLSACRAANPGYDCVPGWVRGEPFGPSTD